MVESRIKKS